MIEFIFVILILISTALVISTIYYYIVLIVLFVAGDMKVKTKKEFKKCFIPYYVWIKKTKDFYNKLED